MLAFLCVLQSPPFLCVANYSAQVKGDKYCIDLIHHNNTVGGSLGHTKHKNANRETKNMKYCKILDNIELKCVLSVLKWGYIYHK